ncbi:MFS transporter, partial [Enterococcus cecorum]|nr:MFS transporter [Enterococcus cecorum]
MKGKNLTLNYSLLQGSYWMSYCALYSFATVYLLSKGFNSAMIGMIVAGSNILSSVLQPYVSTLADQAKKLSIRQIILMVAAVLAILLAGLT